jgi:hypothetical protein
MTTSELNFSRHSQERMLSRKISQEDISICLNYGKKLHRTGIRFYILRDKEVSRECLPERLSGLCVLISNDETIITAYKNRQAITFTKKLNKENLKKFH